MVHGIFRLSALTLTIGCLIAVDGPAPLLTDVTTVDDALWVEAASRRKQRLATAPQPVIVLTETDLVSSPATALPDRLRYVPGIDVYQYRHGQHDIGMRGYNSVGNSRILVMADGLDLRWEGIGSTLWNGSYGATELQRVEIAKGPSSVTYGANAFGGAILMRTREAGNQPETIIQGHVGDPFRTEVDATTLGLFSPRFDYKFSTGYTRLDDLPGATGTTTYTPHPRTANSGDLDTEALRGGGEIGWRIAENWRLAAGYRYTRFNEWEIVEDYDNGANHTDWTFQSGHVRLAAPWGELLYARQVADYFYSNQKNLYTGLNPQPNAFPDFRYAQSGYDDTRDTLRAQGNLTFTNHLLTLGTEYVHYESRSNLWAEGGDPNDDSTWATAKTNNVAAFIEDQWAAAPMWTLTGGLRVDDNSRVGVNASPRLAANFVPNSDEFILVSLSRGYRVPNFIESEIREYYFASDPNLEAETISAIEIEWSQRFNDHGLTVGLNGFANRSNDLIWALPLDGATMNANYIAWLGSGPDFTQQPGPFFQFANLDNPVTVLGLEATARQPITDTPWTLWGNTTWQSYRHRDPVRFQSDGFSDIAGAFGQGQGATVFAMDTSLPRDINAPPAIKVNVGADVAFNRWFGSGIARYVHSREVFSFANSSFSRGILRTQTVDAYLAFDLSIGWEFGAPGSRDRYLRLAILDLFDTAHVEWYQATASNLSANREPGLVSDIGRQVVLEGRWSF